jgi:hypothetical protein
MTAVGYVVKLMTLEIDGTAYECAVTGAQLVPTQQTQEWQTACPDGKGSDVGPTSWSLNVDAVQDWTSETSFSAMLLAHAGELVDFSFEPQADAGVSMTGQCRLVAPPVGGNVGSVAAFSVQLPVVGEPVPAYPAPAGP